MTFHNWPQQNFKTWFTGRKIWLWGTSGASYVNHIPLLPQPPHVSPVHKLWTSFKDIPVSSEVELTQRGAKQARHCWAFTHGSTVFFLCVQYVLCCDVAATQHLPTGCRINSHNSQMYFYPGIPFSSTLYLYCSTSLRLIFYFCPHSSNS